jgi:hypothetical protein
MTRRIGLAVALLPLFCVPTAAHDGPPYPIVDEQRAAGYVVSVWADPDTTNDGTAGGQFWITLSPESAARSPDTSVAVTATSKDDGKGQRVAAALAADGRTRFAALVLNREGPFRIDVDVQGRSGRAHVTADAVATYDLRPPPGIVALYVLPFAMVGLLWARMLLRRRGRLAQVSTARGRLPADATEVMSPRVRDVGR